MLRRSRPIVGNNDRLHGYIRKLHSKQCTVVLCLGGSVTAGHNAGGFGNAYGTLFKKWLDARYPCLNEDGSVGEHVVKMTMAPSSQSNFVHWNKIEQIEKIDLAFIEFNVVSAVYCYYIMDVLPLFSHHYFLFIFFIKERCLYWQLPACSRRQGRSGQTKTYVNVQN
jgi:hypothetical protein